MHLEGGRGKRKKLVQVNKKLELLLPVIYGLFFFFPFWQDRTDPPRKARKRGKEGRRKKRFGAFDK